MGWTDETEIKEENEEDDYEEKSTLNENENENTVSNMSDNNLDSLVPGAMNVEEAAEKEHTSKILIWGNEGTGKSHFCYTMPEPVCYIDTENKADDIAHKFSDKVVHIWQPNDFDEAVEARDEAMNYLSEYQAKKGKKGTIVVDSMDEMWKWAQYKYISKYMPNTNPEDANLSLEDWGPIKKIHNEGFRKEFERCDFHVAWTATRKDDLAQKIEESMDSTPDKPGGESDNVYKVNSIIRLKEDGEGIPYGDLQKSGVVRFKYLGLSRPTYQKHKDIIEYIEELEVDGAETRNEVKSRYGLDYKLHGFTEVNTMRN